MGLNLGRVALMVAPLLHNRASRVGLLLSTNYIGYPDDILRATESTKALEKVTTLAKPRCRYINDGAGKRKACKLMWLL